MHRPTFVLSLLAAFASAQDAPYPILETPVAFDSGYLDNALAVESVVWTQDVTVQGQWSQLRFADANLPAGSRLRIFSLQRPTWVQWHDAHSLRDYRYHSCQFDGPTVRVELLAAPHSRKNRVRIVRAIGHLVDDVAQIDTICGSTDDRVLSNDPRSCRLNSSCSAWLFSEYAVGTAGHCMSSTSGRILHFNAPLSSSTGSTRPAHPNDQYAMEAFLQNLNSGVGQDWCVAAAVRNSNTGLFPGQAQGSWYSIVSPPAFGSGQTIRITGYGTGNGTSGSPTWNQVQKTHTGPRVSTSTANALRYQTDTTGGNSGSPVILENTGEVIGVHTHGGCTSSGTGGNSGTSAARTDWSAARAQVLTLHTVGSFEGFGTGCGATGAAPVLSMTGIPEVGRTVTLRVAGLNGTGANFGLMLLGFGNVTYNGQPLPLALENLGLQGCQLLMAPAAADTAFSLAGQANRAYALPNVPTLVGTRAYFQYFGADANATNPAQMVGTNGGELTIGN